MSRSMQLWIKGASEFEDLREFVLRAAEGKKVAHAPEANESDGGHGRTAFVTDHGLGLIKRQSFVGRWDGMDLDVDVCISFTLNDRLSASEWEAQCIAMAVCCLERRAGDLVLIGDDIPLLVRAGSSIQLSASEMQDVDSVLRIHTIEARMHEANLEYTTARFPRY